MAINWKWGLASVLLAIASFAFGWWAYPLSHTGEEAMANFMSEFSALAYLQKGDMKSAMLVLRDAAERNVILAHRYGVPQLESNRPGATNKWFSEYAQLREKLPTAPHATGGDEFDREVDAILLQATKDNPKAREK